MSNKIGRFEILSELSHSQNVSIYKANDPEGGKTVALKVLDLAALSDQAAPLVQTLLQEADASKVLDSHNIALLYGAGEVDGKFFASLEYVQGNSIATMLARKEGFSIWDLQDIARQTSQGLDHAHTRKIFHYTLEPAKVMVTWDGTVKVLGFGISAMSALRSQATGNAPDVLHYMSPEQLHGDTLDARSNIFSLGAILYEMVTEQKAFAAASAEEVRQQILESNPVPPEQINKKISPALGQVILKALAKSPDDRYQSGQELVNDLERCKESPRAAAPTTTKAVQPPASANLPAKVAAPTSPRPSFTASGAGTTTQKIQVPPAAGTTTQKIKVPVPAVTTTAKQPAVPAPAQPAAKAAVAAAGGGQTPATTATSEPKQAEGLMHFEAQMSAAPVAEPEQEAAPKIAVDPLMAESAGPAEPRASFSEINELPPLKEVVIAPALPPPPPMEETAPESKLILKAPKAPEKPKVQPREVAKKAITEVKKTPPKLFVYSIAAALGLILLIVVGIAFKIHSENAEEEGTPVAQKVAEPAQEPATSAPVQTAPQEAAPAIPVQAEPEQVAAEPHEVSVTPKYNKKNAPKKTAAPSVVPGQLNISSTPAGAQVTVDGRSDPAWITPYNLTGLTPGQHSVVISRTGYSPETRTVDVGSGSKSFLVVQLAATTATLSVSSEPAGAEVFINGRDTGKATPAQIAVEKAGNHIVLLKKQGYLEETTTANLQFGQTFHFSATLKALGNTDDIKYKKMFGRGDTTGMGSVTVKTQPKGAQIAVNRRVLDKNSPTEFYLNPGNYIVDITASGFKDVHKVITVEKGGKVAIDEILERQ